MKNILLVTHGKMGSGIIDSAGIILGDLGSISFVSVTTSETVPVIRGMIENEIKRFANGAPTILITDIAGGSTTQAAISYVAEHPECYLVTGLCLGLLLDMILLELSGEAEADKEEIRTVVRNAAGNMYLANDMLEEDVSDDLL